MQKSHSKPFSAGKSRAAGTQSPADLPAAPALSGLNTALLLLALLLAGWELAVHWRQVPVYILPAPSQILLTLAQNPGIYLQASLVTLFEAAFGLLLGMFAGVTAALALGLWPRLEQGVITLAIFIKSTPLVAIAPLLTIWLGFGVLPKIIITALLTFFPVLVNMVSGLNAADSARLDTLRSWHASRWEMLRHVRLPESLPYFFAALKVSGPLALIGAVVAEWTGASGGLGRLMWLAYTNLNLPYLFAAVFILSTSGILLFSLIHWLERRLLFWER
jgi:ABC-type nitrate/sulfonate/bicarbonate transport system permease component